MSFLTAVLTGFGGYGQGRQQQQDYNLRKQQATSEAELTQQQAETLKQQNEATARGQAFASKMQLPPGWGNMDERQRSAYLTTSYWNAVHAGANDQATQILALLTQSPLAYERYAQGDVSTAKVDLIKAQTTFEQGLPALKRQLAGMAENSAMAVASARIKGMVQVANINARSRDDIAQIAGAIRQKVATDEEAVKQAIAIYQAQMRNYGIQLNPMNGLLEQAAGGTVTTPTMPEYQTPQMQPNVTYNFGPNVGGGGGGGGGGDGGGGGGGQPPPQHYDAAGLAHLIKDAQSKPGVTKQQLSNNLEWMAKQGMASQGDVFNAIRKNGLPPPQ